MSYAGILGDCKCECADAGCPAHKGISDCRAKAWAILYRFDTLDLTGTAFCEDCAEDANLSGLFTSEQDEACEDCLFSLDACICGTSEQVPEKPCDDGSIAV